MTYNSFEDNIEDVENAVDNSAVNDVPTSKGTNILYQPGERVFAAVAPKMIKLGWSVFPQEMEGRRPGKVCNKTIRWSEDYDLKNRRPDMETQKLWSLHCPGLNVACVFGPASGNTFAVDIDVTNENMSLEIADLADQILGYTPFRREGREPKIALIFRHPADDIVASTSKKIKGTEHGVEILGAGKLLTFYGRHHKTGTYFKWLDAVSTPLLIGPERAPEVSSAKVSEFLEAVDAAYTFAKGFSGGAGGTMTWGSIQGVRVPKFKADADLERDNTGKIFNGREEYLTSLCFRTCILGNGPDFHAAQAAGKVSEFSSKICAAIYEEFKENAAMNGRWSENSLKNEISTRVGRLIAKAVAGQIEIKATSPKKSILELKAEMPTIQVRAGEISEAVDDAEAALMKSDLRIFSYADAIVGVDLVYKRTSAGKIKVSRIIERDEISLCEDLSNVAVWERYDSKKNVPIRIDPPKDVVATLMSRKGRCNLPLLEAQISAPTMRADGTILCNPGFDDATGLFLDTAGVAFPPVPAKPNHADALAARDTLFSAIETFPFVSKVDRSVALSAMVTGVVRRSMGSAPMFGFSAVVAGSGKTKLGDICSAVATGQQAEVVSQGRNEEETAKILGSVLHESAPVLMIDNCDLEIGGSFMEQMLTSPAVKVRILGKSEMRTVSTKSLLIATGNNMVIARDMTRRALLCRLDPNVERPETREFACEPVSAAIQRRPELVVAALSLLKAYQIAGKPKQSVPLGSFEIWSCMVRDALIWVGEADPCLAIESARESDPKLEAMQSIMDQWKELIGGKRVTVRELIEVADKQRVLTQWTSEDANPDFREAVLAVAGEGGRINSKRLGKWLGAHAGRLVNGIKIEKAGYYDKTLKWVLVEKDEDAKS